MAAGQVNEHRRDPDGLPASRAEARRLRSLAVAAGGRAPATPRVRPTALRRCGTPGPGGGRSRWPVISRPRRRRSWSRPSGPPKLPAAAALRKRSQSCTVRPVTTWSPSPCGSRFAAHWSFTRAPSSSCSAGPGSEIVVDHRGDNPGGVGQLAEVLQLSQHRPEVVEPHRPSFVPAGAGALSGPMHGSTKRDRAIQPLPAR